MQTHDLLIKKLLRRPGVRTEVERIEREEGVLLDALLKARQDAGLTQAQVAQRMGHMRRPWRGWSVHWQRASTRHQLRLCVVT